MIGDRTYEPVIAPRSPCRRKALVVGNDDYIHLNCLHTATGDSRAIGAALGRLGFAVTRAENLGHQQFVQVLARFIKAIAPGDRVVVHFSGHGVGINARNYLLPVDMPPLEIGSEETIVRGLSIDVLLLIDQIAERRPEYLFAVIDACRNNPFPATHRRSIGLPRGLATLDIGHRTGVVILYAAAPNEAALDRLGDTDPSETSVFTRVLLKHLEIPGTTLQKIAKDTQIGVSDLASTINARQVPEYTDRAPGWQVLGEDVTAPVAVAATTSVNDAPYVPVTTLRPSVSGLRENAAKLSTFFHAIFGGLTAYGRDPEPVETAAGPLHGLAPAKAGVPGASGSLFAIAFSPDGRRLASGSSDGTVKLWDLHLGRLERNLSGHEGIVRSVAFSSDGRFLASGGDDGTARLWDPESGKCTVTFAPHKGFVRMVAFSRAGRFLASVDLSNRITLWDVDTGKCDFRSPESDSDRHDACVHCAAFSPDDDRLASAGEYPVIVVRDFASGRVVEARTGTAAWTTALAFSPDGATLAVGTEKGAVSLRDAHLGDVRQSFDDHRAMIMSVAFSPDGALFGSASEDGTVSMRLAATGELLWRHARVRRVAYGVAFCRESRVLAASVEGGEVRLYQARTGRLLGRLQVLPDGNWATISARGYSASENAHDHLRLSVDGKATDVDEIFRGRWMQA